MSDFKFACPSCGQHVVCDTSNAGMQIACPICQTLLTVPQPPPAAAPAAPTPGRLTINKSSHQPHASAPPPGAANASPKPAWGAKPARVPLRPRKKKSSLVPIGIVCGVLAALAIVWFAIVSPYLQKQAEQKKEAAEAAQRQKDQEAKAAREAAERKKASWKLDLANARFPERPASGKLHGTDFTVENAIFQSGMLLLLQTSGFPRQFIISVPLKGNESLAGKSFDIASNSTDVAQPRIVMSWKDPVETKPGVETYSKGYAMKLQFGSAADGGKLSGKIYLCVPDTQQSFVAGDFQIGPKNPAAVPSGVRGMAAPPPRNAPRMPLPHY